MLRRLVVLFFLFVLIPFSAVAQQARVKAGQPARGVKTRPVPIAATTIILPQNKR